MAHETSYVRDKFATYPAEVISTTLSLAVWLVDEFTRMEPIGPVDVKIEQGSIVATKNLSGYYLFTDLPDGIYRVGFTSDHYFYEQSTVDTSTLEPKRPVVEITLKPNPSYPFPSNATLVRGILITNPTPNEEITIEGSLRRVARLVKQDFRSYIRKYPDAFEILRPRIKVKNNLVYVEHSKLSEEDKKKLGDNALVDLMKYGKEICLSKREYKSYLKKFPEAAEILDKVKILFNEKVYLFLEDIPDDFKEKIGHAAFEQLFRYTRRKTKTNKTGEFVLFFKGLEKTEENISIELTKDAETKMIMEIIEEKTTLTKMISFL